MGSTAAIAGIRPLVLLLLIGSLTSTFFRSMLLGHVMADDTTSHRTEHSVVTGIVPRNAADNGSFDASLGRGGG